MPIKRGYSRDTFEKNYHTLRREGKPHEQALAIAYQGARESYWARFPHGAVPAWMVRPGESRFKPERKKNPVATVKKSNYKKLSCQPCGTDTPHVIAHNPTTREYLYQCSYCGTFKPYGEIAPRRKNPVPPSKHVQVRMAGELYRDFSGHEPSEVVEVKKPEIPDALLAVGDIDGVMYTAVRDGNVEKYIHKFKKKARPLFCVSPDGKQIYLIGGEYDFTERGIVDRA